MRNLNRTREKCADSVKQHIRFCSTGVNLSCNKVHYDRNSETFFQYENVNV